MQTKTS